MAHPLTRPHSYAFPGKDTEESLSIREYFAVRALHGLLAYHGCGYDPYYRPDHMPEESDADYLRRLIERHTKWHQENETIIAAKAVRLADALIAALNAPIPAAVTEDDGQL